MKTADQIEQAKLPVKQENLIQIPSGLLGFEQNKRYVLLTNPEEEPFLWLQMLESPQHTFLVISPFEVCPDYRPDIAQQEVQLLGISNPADAMLLCIVNLRETGQPTVNLKGPIVLNRQTLLAKQVIPLNASEFSLHFPLPIAV